MSCEAYQEQLSLMMDAETGGTEPAGLFAHLEGCADCRRTFDALLRFRGAVRRDRERLEHEADEWLPARPTVPGARPVPAARGAGGRSWLRPAWPAPAALAVAALLVVAGVAIGLGLAGALGGRDRRVPAAETVHGKSAEPTVIYVCSMPEVEVSGAAEPRQSD